MDGLEQGSEVKHLAGVTLSLNAAIKTVRPPANVTTQMSAFLEAKMCKVKERKATISPI